MPEAALREVLRPRKATWALVLLICAGFVAIGVLVLRDPRAAADRTWAASATIFFGLGVLIALLQFVPGSSYLLLTPEGLTIRTMWRTTSYRWVDIERFGVAAQLVGLNFVPAYPRGRLARALMKLNRTLTGFEAALPDNYGRNRAELAAYLNSLKGRYSAS
jgi:hypothetical protein